MYNARCRADRRGCLIILIEQSPTMAEPMIGEAIDAQETKARKAATLANQLLNEVQKRCQTSAVVRPKIDIAVLGYGYQGQVTDALHISASIQELVPISDVSDHPLLVSHTMVAEFDPETGGLVQIPVDIPMWIEPTVGHSSPLCAALETAQNIAQAWVQDHPDNYYYPPMVVNISGGPSTDGDPWFQAVKLMKIANDDGQVLLFNCRISNDATQSIQYPTSPQQVAHDPWSLRLFNMSSLVPETTRWIVHEYYELDMSVGARGFALNSNVTELIGHSTCLAGTLAAKSYQEGQT
jgi:hypothetical protein